MKYLIGLDIEKAHRLDQNISVLKNIVDKCTAYESRILMDSIGILEGIQNQILPYRVPECKKCGKTIWRINNENN